MTDATQLRQEMADVVQQLRVEMNETVNGRMDMLNSISTAIQNVSMKTNDSKPYRISDLIPRNWEGNNEKGEFRSFMSDLHLWMQARSDQGEPMQIRSRICAREFKSDDRPDLYAGTARKPSRSCTLTFHAHISMRRLRDQCRYDSQWRTEWEPMRGRLD